MRRSSSKGSSVRHSISARPSPTDTVPSLRRNQYFESSSTNCHARGALYAPPISGGNMQRSWSFLLTFATVAGAFALTACEDNGGNGGAAGAAGMAGSNTAGGAAGTMNTTGGSAGTATTGGGGSGGTTTMMGVT